VTRAIVFDLFETLVDYDDSRSREFGASVARPCGREPEEFHRVWHDGRHGRETGPMAPYIASLGIEEAAMQGFLELRRSFTREVLGSPREGALEVEPQEALFVGDGANDELAGAERVGMRAVLIHRPREDPAWPEVRHWQGPRITSIPALPALL
jgi:FMN phosphatase YigB (HAD superfamily)